MDEKTIAASTKRLFWLDEGVTGALCVAEAALVWLIFDAIFALPADSPGAVPMWVAIALMWVSATAPRLLEALDIWDPWYQGILVCAISLSTVGSIKILSFPNEQLMTSAWIEEGLNGLILRPSSDVIPVWSVVGLLAYSWWRGHTRADPSIDVAFQLLKTGILFALLGAILTTAIDHDSNSQRSAGPVLLFFVATMVAIGIARLASFERQVASTEFVRNVIVALSPAVLAAVVAVLIAGVFTQETVETIVWAIGPLLWALSILFTIAVLAAALIAMLLLSPVFWLLAGREFKIRAVRIDTSSPFSNTSIQDAASRANDVPDGIRFILAAGLLLLLFAGATRFVLRRRKRRLVEVEGEERETVKPVFNIRGWLNALLRAAGRAKQQTNEDPLAGLRGDPRWAPTIVIRERFAEYLVWSRSLGFGRNAHVTATEHLVNVSKQLSGPGARGDVAELTAIYSRTRYGSSPAEPHEADAANEAWKRLVRSPKSGT